ncbi:MAG: hypothetical protein KKA36_04945 [Gammaproteobacteria bacterium]|nr:hypothetical protein [Gammaproteobacteria bacterium]MBU2478416.1 hypothetical protein [Gammaproteobacteria bacterium]
MLINMYGNSLLAEDGSTRISVSTDFSSLLTGKFGGLYIVSHFEDPPARCI